MVELLLVKVRPMKLCAFGCKASELVCGHSIVGAEFPEVSDEPEEGTDAFCRRWRLYLRQLLYSLRVRSNAWGV